MESFPGGDRTMVVLGDPRHDPAILRAARVDTTLESGINQLSHEDRQYLIETYAVLTRFDSEFATAMQSRSLNDPRKFAQAMMTGRPNADQLQLLSYVRQISPDMDISRTAGSMLSDLLHAHVKRNTPWEEGPVALAWIRSIDSKKNDFSVPLSVYHPAAPSFRMDLSTLAHFAKSDDSISSASNSGRTTRFWETANSRWELDFSDLVKFVRNHLYLYYHSEDYHSDICGPKGNRYTDIFADILRAPRGVDLYRYFPRLVGITAYMYNLSPSMALSELIDQYRLGEEEDSIPDAYADDMEPDHRDAARHPHYYEGSAVPILSEVVFSPPIDRYGAFKISTDDNKHPLKDKLVHGFLAHPSEFWQRFEQVVRARKEGATLIDLVTQEMAQTYDFGNDGRMAKYFALRMLLFTSSVAPEYADDPDTFNRSYPTDYRTALSIFRDFQPYQEQFDREAAVQMLNIERVWGPRKIITAGGPADRDYPDEALQTFWDDPPHRYWEVLRGVAQSIILPDNSSLLAYVKNNITLPDDISSVNGKIRRQLDYYYPLFTLQDAMEISSSPFHTLGGSTLISRDVVKQLIRGMDRYQGLLDNSDVTYSFTGKGKPS